jgi:probable phosphoglycerate mutase
VGLRGVENAPLPEEVGREEVRRRILEHPTWDVFPGSEGRLAFRRRIVGAVDRIIAEQPARRAAVVCHGGVIQTYVAHVLGLDSDFPFYAFNASIASVRALGERRALWRLNDIAHLDGLPVGYEGIS